MKGTDIQDLPDGVYELEIDKIGLTMPVGAIIMQLKHPDGVRKKVAEVSRIIKPK